MGSYKIEFKKLKGQIPTLDYYVHDNWESYELIVPWQNIQGALPGRVLFNWRSFLTQCNQP